VSSTHPSVVPTAVRGGGIGSGITPPSLVSGCRIPTAVLRGHLVVVRCSIVARCASEIVRTFAPEDLRTASPRPCRRYRGKCEYCDQERCGKQSPELHYNPFPSAKTSRWILVLLKIRKKISLFSPLCQGTARARGSDSSQPAQGAAANRDVREVGAGSGTWSRAGDLLREPLPGTLERDRGGDSP
jgi:hypothetical protein